MLSDIRNPNCELCPLHKEANHVCLMGRGPTPCDIMIVGEAPGYNEDKEGRPFIGKAGELLTSLLHDVGIKRKNCYITNAVKCRPPGNRTPTRTEIKACSVYLEAELEAVKPKYILLLGNTALQAMTRYSGLKKRRGQWYDAHGAKVMATYHPAAAFRNPSYLPTIRADMMKFSQGTSGLLPKEIKITYRTARSETDVDEYLALAKQAKIVAYDIETKDDLVLCYGSAMRMPNGEEIGYFIPLGHPQAPRWFRANWRYVMHKIVPLLQRKGPYKKVKTVGQFGKFDDGYFMRVTKKCPRLYFDVGLCSWILDENSPHDLGYLARTYLNARDYKEEVDRANLQDEQIKKMASYNMQDNFYTLHLYYVLKKQLKKDPRLWTLFFHTTMPASRALVRAEYYGLHFDRERIEQLINEEEHAKASAHGELAKFFPPGKRINIRSTKQLSWLMFAYLGLEPIFMTKKGIPSTAKGSLVWMEHPFVDALEKYRKHDKILGTYLYAWRDKMDTAGYIHTSFKLHGTVTGRVSSEEPNLQNVSRDSKIRSCISAPPGWTLVEADYSQIELRIAAEMAHERTMLRIYKTGGDIHTETAMAITGKAANKLTKEERSRAKPVNFGFLYGMGTTTFRQYAKEKFETTFTQEEAMDLRKKFFRRYSDLPAWHMRQRRVVQKLGYVRSLFGRKRRLPDVYSSDEEVQSLALRQAINSPVQAVPPDLCFMAVDKLTHEKGFWKECRWLMQIHDANIFMVKDKYLNKWCRIIKDAHEKLPLQTLFNVEIGVPIVVEIKVSKRWGEGVEWEADKDAETIA